MGKEPGAAGGWTERDERFRTLSLNLALTGVIFLFVIALLAVIALASVALMRLGVLHEEFYLHPLPVLVVVLLGSAALAALVAGATYVSIVRPLRRMATYMHRLAEGSFEVRMPPKGRFEIREVGEFARSFNHAAEELAGTETMRAGFVSDFSHEFRTPISSIAGFAQLLREDGVTDEERGEYLGIIADEARRLSRLSERILLLSRVEAASILPDAADVNLAEQVRRCLALVQARADEKGIELSASLDECRVRGNADYLSQLWLNLLDNAIKFTPAGGRVDVSLYAGDAEAVAWISDSGPGMDERTREHLFDRFYKGDSSHASEGNGLGLALAKRIVELHGGSISVATGPTSGTTFEVRLPG